MPVKPTAGAGAKVARRSASTETSTKKIPRRKAPAEPRRKRSTATVSAATDAGEATPPAAATTPAAAAETAIAHDLTTTPAKTRRKPAPKAISLVLKVLGTIDGELTKLEQHTGKSSQDRERASRALSQMVTSLEKTVDMQRQIGRDKNAANGAQDKEAMRNADDMRRRIGQGRQLRPAWRATCSRALSNLTGSRAFPSPVGRRWPGFSSEPADWWQVGAMNVPHEFERLVGAFWQGSREMSSSYEEWIDARVATFDSGEMRVIKRILDDLIANGSDAELLEAWESGAPDYWFSNLRAFFTDVRDRLAAEMER